MDSLNNIKNSIEKSGRNVKLFRPKHSQYKGQILGCNIQEFKGVNAFLYIGDGLFHPAALSIKNKEPVFTFNPFTGRFQKTDEAMVKDYHKKQEIALKKFYMSENIGILVSTKPGQNRLKHAMRLKKNLDKNVFIMLSNEINPQGLLDFPFIDVFINTACPRISYDDYMKFPKPVLDLENVPE